MSRIPARSLVDVELSEETFKADFDLTSFYQAFSAELLRLSLLGIAGYGFLLSELLPKQEGFSANLWDIDNSERYTWMLGIGVVCLGLSAAAALAHRFFSTDCLSHQITILRLLKRSASPNWTEEERKIDVERLGRERDEQHADLRRCRRLLVASASLLFLGAIAVALTFAATLFSHS
jgi:hypothetical protein